jgi:glycosyltransferase involved in cell wall biosynthesis
MKPNIAIITFPLGAASRVPLSNLTKLCGDLARMVYIVSGNLVLEISCENFKLMRVDYKLSTKIYGRLFNYLNTQLQILRWVISISRKVDLFIFTLEGEFLPIPALMLRLLRKKVVLMPAGDEVKGYSLRKEPISGPVSVLVNLTSMLANSLVIYSRRIVQTSTFARYQHKTIIAHRHFVDFSKFAVKKKISARENVVGYIGRFSKEKGILKLAKSIPIVLKHRKTIHFTLCGEGNLSDEVRTITRYAGSDANVKLTGWVSHEEIPSRLNDFKLLVLPSYTEGLPNSMLEAMACGTPVLAASVGAIPDIIKDGENGFLLKSNTPEHIAERIVEIFDKPKLLERVSINAYNHVRDQFSYAATLKKWQKIITAIGVS